MAGAQAGARMRRLLIAAVALAPAAPALAGPVAAPPLPWESRAGDAARLRQSSDALLERARLWQGRGRDDLAEGELRRLFRVAPDHPEGLELRAGAQLRANQLAEAAATRERLRRRAPEHPGLQRIDVMLRLKGVDKDKLSQARRLAETGHEVEALKAMRALHVDLLTDPALALEYWNVVASTPDSWEAVRAGLARLAAQEPDNLLVRLALAEHLSTHDGVFDPEPFQTITALGRAGGPAQAPARAAWRRVLRRLGPNVASVAAMRAYLAVESGDGLIQERYASFLAEVRRRGGDAAGAEAAPRSEAEALLDAGKFEQAEALLARAGDDDAPALQIGLLGLLRMRQGRHDEALVQFERAVRRDPSNSGRWESLAQTARYWDLMHQASEARARGDAGAAERLARQAMQVDPKDANAVLLLGRIHAQAGRAADAEQAYQAALRLAPDDADALEALITLYLQQDRDAEADASIARLTAEQRGKMAAALNDARAGALRGRADRALNAGQPARAIALLEQAAALAPDAPWPRYDLGRLYAAGGGADGAARALALFDALLARHPGAAEPLYALALLQSGLGRDDDALLTLERIAAAERTAAMTELQHALWGAVQRRRVAALAAAGRREAVAGVLEQVQTAVAGDPGLAPELALVAADAGDRDGALALLAQAARALPAPSPGWRIRQAQALLRLDQDEALRAVLALPALSTGAVPADDLRALSALRRALRLRDADRLRQQGRQEAALARLAPLQADGEAASVADSVEVLRARAGLLRDLYRWEPALQATQQWLQLARADHDAAALQIEIRIATGQTALARELIAAELARADAPDGAQQAALARALRRCGDAAGADALVAAALLTYPAERDLLEQAAERARTEHQLRQEIDYRRGALAARAGAGAGAGAASTTDRQVLSRLRLGTGAGGGAGAELLVSAAPAPVAPGAIGPAADYRQLAELLDQDGRWLSAAVDNSSRSGAAGKSAFAAHNASVQWNGAWQAGRHWFYRADAVRLSASSFDPADPGAATFGSVLLCGAQCPAEPQALNARGLALGAGLESENDRIDVGTTPLGFAITNLVGGVLHKGDLGPFSYSAELSRRAVTSSLLSFAGLRDPNTGRRWGGVLANGVKLGLSKDDGGRFGVWSTLGLQRLTGTEVIGNTRAQLMGGGYWRAINRTDQTLTFGATALLWRHSHNAGEYTFGHGGYYSPRKFTSLSLPVSYALRGGRWSLAVRAAMAASRSSTSAAPYFPTDAALQDQGGDAAQHTASNSPRSISRSFAAGAEYQVGARLFAGVRMEIERSTDYTPNRMMLYLRYGVDRPAARPVSLPPEPVQPGYQY